MSVKILNSFLSHSMSALTKEENEQIVKEWLKKNNIYYDKLIFSPEDKLDIYINNNIDIMIEDKEDNINKISTKLLAICFNAGYNENCKGKNIFRTYTWYDVFNTIKINFNKGIVLNE